MYFRTVQIVYVYLTEKKEKDKFSRIASFLKLSTLLDKFLHMDKFTCIMS